MSGLLVKGRLSKQVLPASYDLQIYPNLTNNTFLGQVSILINFNDYESEKFALHIKDLNITSVKFDDTEVRTEKYESEELLVIHTEMVPIKFQHTLSIQYSGHIRSDLMGFYKASDKIYATQFEPADARSVFPCFDEPNFKAVFKLTLANIPNNFTVLANTLAKHRVGDDKITSYEFEDSPFMSTYLLAFAIGEVNYLETYHDRFQNGVLTKVRIRVYGTSENETKFGYALDIAKKCLKAFEEFFAYPYPMNKLDLIGIPNFAAGAMENFGLITYRESALFCSADSELSHKQNVCQTVCHEIAHQWFGNLVTMDWWKYLWLNESMATYFQWYISDLLFPEWELWNEFVNKEFKYALTVDSLASSHPIEVDIENVKDLNQIFDGISYSKGSCLVRFLANRLRKKNEDGEVVDNFRKGMQLYISTHAYKNTTSEDLWEAFSRVSGEDISSLMNSWTKQTGYPVLSLEKKEEIKELYEITQKKFLKTGPNEDLTKWIISLDMNMNLIDYNITLSTRSVSFPLKGTLILNPDRIGFYRVDYKTITFNITELSVNLQKQIFDDMFTLALSGYSSLYQVFDQLKKLDMSKVTNYNLLDALLINLTSIYNLLNGEPDLQLKLKQFIEKYILPQVIALFSRIGWDDKADDDINTLYLRPLLINFLGLMENRDIIEQALKRFSEKNYKYNLAIIGSYASNKEFDEMLVLKETSSDPQIRSDLATDIGNVRNPELVDRVLSNLFKFKSQDIWITIRSLSINKNATDKIFEFVLSNWNKILEVYKTGSHELTMTIKSIAFGLNKQTQLDRFSEFFRVPPLGTEMGVNQSKEHVTSKLLSINRIKADREFLEFLS